MRLNSNPMRIVPIHGLATQRPGVPSPIQWTRQLTLFCREPSNETMCTTASERIVPLLLSLRALSNRQGECIGDDNICLDPQQERQAYDILQNVLRDNCDDPYLTSDVCQEQVVWERDNDTIHVTFWKRC